MFFQIWIEVVKWVIFADVFVSGIPALLPSHRWSKSRTGRNVKATGSGGTRGHGEAGLASPRLGLVVDRKVWRSYAPSSSRYHCGVTVVFFLIFYGFVALLWGLEVIHAISYWNILEPFICNSLNHMPAIGTRCSSLSTWVPGSKWDEQDCCYGRLHFNRPKGDKGVALRRHRFWKFHVPSHWVDCFVARCSSMGQVQMESSTLAPASLSWFGKTLGTYKDICRLFALLNLVGFGWF